MKKAASICGLALFLLTSSLAFSQAKPSAKNLDPRYRKWLEEEVVYIITPKEKEVFLQLGTDREREIFIEAFWRQRDPNLTTPENEFKTEHHKRIEYANKNFGKEGPGAGWRSDMGRIYIILGQPKSIDRFENMSEVHPVVIWFYEGLSDLGLPSAFSVVFFRKDSVGEYELYSPIKHGPQSLLIHYQGDMSSYLDAYNMLFNIEPSIASVSLSLIHGEDYGTFSPSIASEVMLGSRIPKAGYERVKDTYAEKLLAYKDIIDVDYSANYMDSESLVRVIRDPSGMFFVHYLIEPRKLTFERVDNRFLSRLEINGSVRDLRGNTVYQFDRTVPIEMNENQAAGIRSKLFSFQDMFPLISGAYTLNVLFKNAVSKEFTSLEADLTVPEAGALRMSPVVLANRISRDSKYRGQNKPFLIGNDQLVPSPRNDFTVQDTLYVHFQIQGLTPDLEESGSLECAVYKDQEKMRSAVKSLKDHPGRADFLEEFSLADLPPAYYSVKVSLFDKERAAVLSEQSPFYISSSASVPRPWVLSLPKPPDESPDILNVLGIQFLNKNDVPRARPLLETAYRKNPRVPAFALDFCRVLFLTKEYSVVKEIALPFLKEPPNHNFLQVAGQACQALGEWEEAVAYYKEHLTRLGTNINILNSIGDCYNQLGNAEEALRAYEKSLEINPKQEKIRALIKSLKERN